MLVKQEVKNTCHDRDRSSGADEYPVSYACPCDPRALAGWKAMGIYGAPPFFYTEPVQGCCGDCYLVAALSSVAWAAPARISANQLSIPFRDPNTGQSSNIALATDMLPVDAADTLIYARSSSGKTWPMVYEKAFAKWKNVTLIGGDPDHPDISKLSGGAGMYGLLSVTRYAHKAEFSTNANNILASIPKNPTGKTLYPSVAWTHDLAAPPAGILNDHTYSILGFYQNNVVLRNPFTSMEEPAGSVKLGIWNAAPGVAINLANAPDGVFALTAADFNKYFYGFGYVTP